MLPERERKMPRLALLDPTKTGTQAEDLEKKLRRLVIGQDVMFDKPIELAEERAR